MQRLSEIREILTAAGRDPAKALGQNFLIDANLMAKLVELADLTGAETVLEVGPATGSLTEELLPRCRRLVAVELDRDLAAILRQRLGHSDKLTVLNQDVLADKHTLAPEVLSALAGDPGAPGPAGGPATAVHLVSNLPYNVAVPIIMNCLLLSWRALQGSTGVTPVAFAKAGETPALPLIFERLTFTVQKELAERLLAPPGGSEYGPVSILVALLTRPTTGRIVPPQAFWPPPKVRSQMLRLDFDPAAAARLASADTLAAVLSTAFAQRRKKILAVTRRGHAAFTSQAFLSALEQAGVDQGLRPQQLAPEQFRTIANCLSM